jgi:hypothetical protein
MLDSPEARRVDLDDTRLKIGRDGVHAASVEAPDWRPAVNAA